MSSSSQRVVVLGASPKADRYSNRAVRLLTRHGHTVVPVHPTADRVENVPVSAQLADVDGDIDTLTIYVSPEISSGIASQIADAAPDRVIFNPGSENAELAEALAAKGITVEEACTLVLLNTGQF